MGVSRDISEPVSPDGEGRRATARSVEAVWRIESARLVGALARQTGDVGLAEDIGQDALVKALETWPRAGIPEDPFAWLLTTARNAGIDRIRRDQRLREKYADIGADLERSVSPDQPGPDRGPLDPELLGDDLLGLIFTACHPALSTDSQVALTLRVLGGLSTEEIARAFLVATPTAAQRISRAKRTLADAGVSFHVPDEREMGERLGSVLGVIYLIFNEGYAATAGDDWVRPDLCQEAMRLGRILAGLIPDESEVTGLLALMEMQASRLAARTGPDGQPLLLEEQDRTAWDRLLIRRGLAGASRAMEVTEPGPYALEAALAACHARASTFAETDWNEIVSLYDRLLTVRSSPVIDLNRAIAISRAEGPAAGLSELERIPGGERFATYHPFPAARGDMLARLGRQEEAAAEFERAAELATNEAESRILKRRADECNAMSNSGVPVRP